MSRQNKNEAQPISQEIMYEMMVRAHEKNGWTLISTVSHKEYGHQIETEGETEVARIYEKDGQFISIAVGKDNSKPRTDKNTAIPLEVIRNAIEAEIKKLKVDIIKPDEAVKQCYIVAESNAMWSIATARHYVYAVVDENVIRVTDSKAKLPRNYSLKPMRNALGNKKKLDETYTGQQGATENTQCGYYSLHAHLFEVGDKKSLKPSEKIENANHLFVQEALALIPTRGTPSSRTVVTDAGDEWEDLGNEQDVIQLSGNAIDDVNDSLPSSDGTARSSSASGRSSRVEDGDNEQPRKSEDAGKHPDDKKKAEQRKREPKSILKNKDTPKREEREERHVTFNPIVNQKLHGVNLSAALNDQKKAWHEKYVKADLTRVHKAYLGRFDDKGNEEYKRLYTKLQSEILLSLFKCSTKAKVSSSEEFLCLLNIEDAFTKGQFRSKMILDPRTDHIKIISGKKDVYAHYLPSEELRKKDGQEQAAQEARYFQADMTKIMDTIIACACENHVWDGTLDKRVTEKDLETVGLNKDALIDLTTYARLIFISNCGMLEHQTDYSDKTIAKNNTALKTAEQKPNKLLRGEKADDQVDQSAESRQSDLGEGIEEAHSKGNRYDDYDCSQQDRSAVIQLKQAPNNNAELLAEAVLTASVSPVCLNAKNEGSTVVSALYSNNRVTVASIGDSSAILFTETETGSGKYTGSLLTKAQKASDHAEIKRAKSELARCTGKDINDRSTFCIGDIGAGGVRHPTITEQKIPQDDGKKRFLVLVSDGITDSMTIEEMEEILGSAFDGQNKAAAIQDCAFKWHKKFRVTGDTREPTLDNQTVLVAPIVPENNNMCFVVADGNGSEKKYCGDGISSFIVNHMIQNVVEYTDADVYKPQGNSAESAAKKKRIIFSDLLEIETHVNHNMGLGLPYSEKAFSASAEKRAEEQYENILGSDEKQKTIFKESSFGKVIEHLQQTYIDGRITSDQYNKLGRRMHKEKKQFCDGIVKNEKNMSEKIIEEINNNKNIFEQQGVGFFKHKLPKGVSEILAAQVAASDGKFHVPAYVIAQKRLKEFSPFRSKTTQAFYEAIAALGPDSTSDQVNKALETFFEKNEAFKVAIPASQ